MWENQINRVVSEPERQCILQKDNDQWLALQSAQERLRAQPLSLSTLVPKSEAPPTKFMDARCQGKDTTNIPIRIGLHL